jgi:hypothetical protein
MIRGKELRIIMKCATLSKSFLLGAALILASSAFAASKASVQLTNPVMINGTQLKAGDYKVQWEGAGPDVEVSFMQGKTVVAKTSAHVVNLDNAPSNNAAVVRRSDDGTNTLSGVRFEGKKIALEIGNSNDNMQSGSAK